MSTSVTGASWKLDAPAHVEHVQLTKAANGLLNRTPDAVLAATEATAADGERSGLQSRPVCRLLKAGGPVENRQCRRREASPERKRVTLHESVEMKGRDGSNPTLSAKQSRKLRRVGHLGWHVKGWLKQTEAGPAKG
jgi:hypothetical protein